MLKGRPPKAIPPISGMVIVAPLNSRPLAVVSWMARQSIALSFAKYQSISLLHHSTHT